MSVSESQELLKQQNALGYIITTLKQNNVVCIYLYVRIYVTIHYPPETTLILR